MRLNGATGKHCVDVLVQLRLIVAPVVAERLLDDHILNNFLWMAEQSKNSRAFLKVALVEEVRMYSFRCSRSLAAAAAA